MRKFLLAFLFAASLAQTWAAEPRFDWSQVLEIPPGAHLSGGHQILHFKCQDKSLDAEAVQFVEKYMPDAVVLKSDAEVLRFGSDAVKIQGLFVELGVCTGKTVNFIAALNPHQKIYGFDSFEGLPEDWEKGDKVIKRGTFAFKIPGLMPPVLHNVDLIKGLFDQTLVTFHQEQDPKTPIAFLHVDCDIYSSTATAFKVLAERIVPGTIIVFDEFFNYPAYAEHEFKALQELLAARHLEARYLAYNMNHEQVAVEIIQAE